MDSPCIKQTVCKVLNIFQYGKYLLAYVLKNENFATLLLLLKTCSTFYLRHLRTFSQVLATFIKHFNLVFCILKCMLILLMGNIKFYHKIVSEYDQDKTVFTVCLLKQR